MKTKPPKKVQDSVEITLVLTRKEFLQLTECVRNDDTSVQSYITAAIESWIECTYDSMASEGKTAIHDYVAGTPAPAA